MCSRLRPAAIVVAALALVVAGACAKRPDLRVASAPAPAPRSAPPAAPVAPQPPPAVETPAVETPASVPVATAPPEPARPVPAEFSASPALREIHFDFDKSDIRPADAQILDSNASWLVEHPDHLVLIEGHCDERGTNEYNLALGDRRARRAMEYIVSRGVAADRISTVSYGEERPLCTEKNETCWSANRRAMFVAKQR